MSKLRFQYVAGPQGRETLSAFLARRFPYHDQPEWSALVEAGNVTVNAQPVSPQLELRSGHRIVYKRPATAEPEVDKRFRVLFEDEHILAVEKSANLPTSPSGKYWDHCLVHIVAKELGFAKLYAVHRLDRETSGVNLLAKSAVAAGALGKAFAGGMVHKEYTAVLRGELACGEAFVSVPLMNDPIGEIRVRQVPSPDGRTALTRFTLLARIEAGSLVRAEPLTGRTHQIRAHAWYLGYPIVGDKLYGASDDAFLEFTHQHDRNSSPRQLLHASRIRFPHPMSETPMNIHCPADTLLKRS